MGIRNSVLAGRSDFTGVAGCLSGDDVSPLMSLSLAILICGLVWLPVRGWLQARLLQRKKLSDSELFERILQVSFAVNEQERQLQWKALLNDLFQPLNLK